MSESKALHQARTWLETWHTKYVASLTALIEAARADERRACVATEARGRIDVRDRQGRYWRQYNDAWQDGVNALRDAIRADVREWEDQKRSCPRCGAEWRNEDGFGTACRKCNERGRVREMGDVTIRSIGTEERTGAAGGDDNAQPNPGVKRPLVPAPPSSPSSGTEPRYAVSKVEGEAVCVQDRATGLWITLGEAVDRLNGSALSGEPTDEEPDWRKLFAREYALRVEATCTLQHILSIRQAISDISQNEPALRGHLAKIRDAIHGCFDSMAAEYAKAPGEPEIAVAREAKRRP